MLSRHCHIGSRPAKSNPTALLLMAYSFKIGQGYDAPQWRNTMERAVDLALDMRSRGISRMSVSLAGLLAVC